MLVLTRKIDQSIMIGDDVEIVVLEINGSQVRLGVRAPREIRVHRREVFDAVNALAPVPEDEPAP